MPGKFKKEFHLKKNKQYNLDIVTVGDYVEFTLNQDKSGVILEVINRKNYLSRKAPSIKGAGFRGERLEQIVAANIEKLFIVCSADNPRFNNRLLDRIIVAGESANLQLHIIVNKIDLDFTDEMSYWKVVYENLGYRVYFTDARTGKGIEAIKEDMQGVTSVFWGASGVGKSSILNCIDSRLNLKTGDTSAKTNKGIHTTVTTLLIPVSENTFLIDTPGIREIEPYGLKKEDLHHYFRDLSPYAFECRFNTCTHHHEPGCAVIEAFENEKVNPFRYESYLNMLETIEDDMLF